MYKKDLALHDLQWLLCYKNQPTNQPTNQASNCVILDTRVEKISLKMRQNALSKQLQR